MFIDIYRQVKRKKTNKQKPRKMLKMASQMKRMQDSELILQTRMEQDMLALFTWDLRKPQLKSCSILGLISLLSLVIFVLILSLANKSKLKLFLMQLL